MSWELFGELLPQALGVALSPMPIVLVMLMLVSARAKTNGPAYMIGWYLGAFTLPFVAYLLADGAAEAVEESTGKGMNLIQIGLGLLLVWFAWGQWKARPRRGEDAPTPKLFEGVDSMAAHMALGMGLLFATVNAKNTPIGISVGTTTAQAGLDLGTSVGTLLMYALVASLSVIIPTMMVLIAGDAVREPLDEVRDWLIDHNSVIMAVIFGFLGAKILGQGLALFG